MKKERIFEILVGTGVLLCAVWFFIYSYTKSSWRETDGYYISAKFDSIDGISSGSDVKISGVKIGVVTSVEIEPDTYLALVKLKINKTVKLPKDSEASISSEGILGGKYISLSPGSDEEQLLENGTISRTKGGQNLESMINQFLMSPKDNK